MVTTQFKAGNETARRHIFNAGNRPICGGGYGAKSVVAWQIDLGEADCQRCLAILERQKTKQTKQTEER